MRVTAVIVFCAMLLTLQSSAAFAAGGGGIADAAKNKDLQTVRSLLKQGVDVNVPQLDGTTALHWATRWDNVELVDLLIRGGAKVNVKNRNGSTPMMLACENGNAAIIEKLLEAGADAGGNLLLNGETPLMMAARSGSVQAVNLLLDHGANVNVKESGRGTTALMWAASENRSEIVKILIAHGADKNAQANVVLGPPQRGKTEPTKDGGATPLILAVRERARNAAQVLLDAGADPNLQAADGSTPMLVAAINQDHDMGALVLKYGGNPDVTNDLGWNVLYMTVRSRYPDIGAIPIPNESELPAIDFIQMLLENGADPNIRMGTGTVLRNDLNPRWLREPGATPFVRASFSGDVQIMQLLLAYGADPTLTTLDKTTALMAASGVGWTQGVSQEISEDRTVEAVRMLLDLGLDVKAANNLGITALHGAAAKGANRVAELLVSRGADLTAKAKAPYLGQVFELLPLDFAVGVSLNAFSPFAHSDTAQLLRTMMTAKDIPILKNSRQQAVDNNLKNLGK